MEAINLGATICFKLKEIYFNETNWIDCYKLIAQKFSSLKGKMRKFYTDKCDEEILKILTKFSSQDINDVMKDVEDVEWSLSKRD